MNPGRIFVCSTCARHAPSAPGEPTRGEAMVQAVRQASNARDNAIAVRQVECLNGCPNPCTAALRIPGKLPLRFCRLIPEDAASLIEVALLYGESETGALPRETLPTRLREKMVLQAENFE